MSVESADPGVGPWQPLQNRLFVLLAIASLGANFGTFMHGLGAAWVLTDLTDSPVVVTLLLVALAVPTLALALFAGALADVVDRRRLLVVAQGGLAVVSAVFVALTAAGSITTGQVIGLTAALGALTALASPAWIALIPEVVSRKQLPAAMTISSAAMTLAQAIGPAIAGVVIALAGPEWVFAINAALFIAVVGALRTWTPEARDPRLPAEHVVSAMKVGLRYARNEPALAMVIAKTVPFALCSTALAALLPAVARFRLDAGPTAFGGLSAAMGLGAVAALFVLPKLRPRLGPDGIVAAAMVVYAGVLIALGATTTLWIAFIALAFAGGATLAFVSTVITAVQMVLPSWVRGRGLAVFLLALQAAFAIGAVAWGAIAEGAGLGRTLFIAGLTMIAASLVTLPVRLSRLTQIDATPAELSWAQPHPRTSLHDNDGPILVSIEWSIDPDQRDAFVEAMQPVRRALQREGALGWHLYDDIEVAGRLLETFTLPTWAEFQRLPQRATQDDRKLEEGLRAFLPEGSLPEARHYRSSRH